MSDWKVLTLCCGTAKRMDNCGLSVWDDFGVSHCPL